MKRKIIKRIFFLIFLIIVFCIGFFVYKSQPKPFSSWRISAKLLDASSGLGIANAEVEIYSDNGIRCIKAPCPAEVRSWQGISNDKGILSFPGEFLNSNAGLDIANYHGGSLADDIEKNAAGEWFFVLDKRNTNDDAPHFIRLIDLQTGSAIAEAPLLVTNSSSCKNLECSDFIFKANTNILGNFYYPASLPNSDNTFIIVKGYKVSNIGSVVRNKLILERE